eukprot:1895864-Lingulodinium_polyedra.AAC.1
MRHRWPPALLLATRVAATGLYSAQGGRAPPARSPHTWYPSPLPHRGAPDTRWCEPVSYTHLRAHET